MPPDYPDIDKCREEIEEYAEHLRTGTDDNDSNQRNTRSTKRYEQDLRWFDSWLDDRGLDTVQDVDSPEAMRLGKALSNEFSGTTGRYRWDRIMKMYDWFVRCKLIGENPLEPWNDDKKTSWGLTKTTAQETKNKEDEAYALSQDEIRLMEDNVGRNRLRDQLLIRFLFHSALRRSEASHVKIEHLDREKREVRIPAENSKNNKERYVVWQPNLDGLLREWLDDGYRAEYAAGADHDYLFVGERGGRLRGEAINDIVVRAADNAGINEKTYSDANAVKDEDGNTEPNRWKITSHSVRRGAGTKMIESDAGIYAVSKYLGHQSVKITEQSYISYDPRAGVPAGKEFGPE